jgi:DNA polymerase-3 subunit beta
MEFEVVREKFSKALSTANKAISVKASLPILQNVLIEQDKGRLKLTTTDLDRSIITWVGSKITGDSSVTIPAKPLFGFVSGLTSEKLTGVVSKDGLKIKTKGTSAAFNGVNAKDYPTLDYALSDDYFEIKTDLLKRAIDETYFTASTDDSKPAWTGILLKIVEGNLHIVSLDGFRLAKKELVIKDATLNFKKSFEQVIIPAKNLTEVLRLAGSIDTLKVDVQEKKSVVLFYLDDVLFVSKILEGQFPDYEKAIPANSVSSFEVESKNLLNALKLASVFATDQNAVRFSIDPKKGILTVSSDDVELGNNKLDVAITNVTGESLDIAFNAKYILDYLNNVPSDVLTIKCSGQSSPASFVPLGRVDYIHVAVPLQPYWE